MNGSKTGLVLQGYFSMEWFRDGGGRAVTNRPMAANNWVAKAPRPDLMPARMRDEAVQAKGVAGSAWPGAPRPELLPGMVNSTGGVPGWAAQARANNGVVTVPVSRGWLGLVGQGRPLHRRIRAQMEEFLDADFSEVRVHEGPVAKRMGALAFTQGETVHFAPGRYDPATREGVELLAHELTHVVQQRTGRVTSPYAQGVAIVQDPELEAEADSSGRRAAEAIWSGAGAYRGGSMQRRAGGRVYGLEGACIAVVDDPTRAHTSRYGRHDRRRPALSGSVVLRACVQPAFERVSLRDDEYLDQLRSMSRLFRGYGKVLRVPANEFQGMRIGSQIFVTGNTREDTTAVFAELEEVCGRAAYRRVLTMGTAALQRSGSRTEYDTQDFDPVMVSELILDVAVKKNRWVDPSFTSSIVGVQSAAGLLGAGGPSIILVGGDPGGLHAEQRLLLVLASILASGADIPDCVQIGGSKPPCTRCKPIVETFNANLRRYYGVTLHYVTNGPRKNCGLSVKQIGVGDLPDGAKKLLS